MPKYVKNNMKVKRISCYDITKYSLELLKKHKVEYVVSNYGTVVKIDLDSLTDILFKGEHIGELGNINKVKTSNVIWNPYSFYPCKLLSETPKYINKDCK